MFIFICPVFQSNVLKCVYNSAESIEEQKKASCIFFEDIKPAPSTAPVLFPRSKPINSTTDSKNGRRKKSRNLKL